MAITYKVLGQADPVAATLTNAYTVPGSTEAVISSIQVCNRANAAKTVRVSIAPAGAADAVIHYLLYDFSLAANVTHTLKLGITLATTDVIRVYAVTQDVTFSIFGLEIS